MKTDQGFGTPIIIGIVALLIIGGGYVALQGGSPQTQPAMDESMEEQHNDDVMMTDDKDGDNAMMMDDETSDDAMMEEKKVGEAMMEEAMKAESGSYEDFESSKLAKAENGDVVLFFHAKWCPACRSADKNLKEANIPEGVHVLKLDYDAETSLKRKYGVTTQHTFIHVNANGEIISKWTGSRTIDDIVAKL